MDSHSEYRTLIDEVRRTDSFGSREFFTRLALLTAGCAIGFFWMGLDIIPYWYAAYYSAVLAENLLLLQFPAATSRRFMTALIAVSAVISVIFVALPVYLWFQQDSLLRFAALVLLVGGCLNIYQLRSRVWPVALAYFVPIGAGFVIMAAGYWIPTNGGAEFWAAIAVAILISFYFALTLIEAHKANRRMQRTQAHLIKSQKIEALESLAAGISHEFRSVLSVIQGNLELLQEHPKSYERSACIRDALAAARSGNELCTQLGLYSRRTTDTASLVDPVRVVDDVRQMARHILPSTIRLQIQTPSAIDQLRVDERALQAVLLNLIVHARDTVDGSGTISLETYVTGASCNDRRRSRNSSKVVFAVGNSGSDQIPDMQATFDGPESGPMTGGRANGLALATARGFAETAGGDFRIEPNLGRGTRVLLQLPA